MLDLLRKSKTRMDNPHNRYADPILAERLRRMPSHDSIFANALAGSPVVLGVIGSDTTGVGAEGSAHVQMLGGVGRPRGGAAGRAGMQRGRRKMLGLMQDLRARDWTVVELLARIACQRRRFAEEEAACDNSIPN